MDTLQPAAATSQRAVIGPPVDQLQPAEAVAGRACGVCSGQLQPPQAVRFKLRRREAEQRGLTCSACRQLLPMDAFYSRSRGRMCKQCVRARNRAYYRQNAERLKAHKRQPEIRERENASRRERYARNPEQVKRLNRDHYCRNLDQQRERARQSYYRRRDAILAYKRAYRAANRETLNAKARARRAAKKAAGCTP